MWGNGGCFSVILEEQTGMKHNKQMVDGKNHAAFCLKPETSFCFHHDPQPQSQCQVQKARFVPTFKLGLGDDTNDTKPFVLLLSCTNHLSEVSASASKKFDVTARLKTYKSTAAM